MEHEVVTVVVNKEVRERCPLYVLDKYIEKLPQKAKEMYLFYCRPCAILPAKKATHGLCQLLLEKKNTLYNIVKMCEMKLELMGNKTNHSLIPHSHYRSKLF